MNRALFLDRDGVVNVELNYLYKIEDFKFIDGILDLCKYYQKLGYIIIIVTNQSGIARGYYTQGQFFELTSWMIGEFARHGIKVDKVYHCPHHPDISGECTCRKPSSGMLLKAQRDFEIDMLNSLLVGDKESDIEAAIHAGIKETYLFDEKNETTFSKASKIVSRLEDIYNVNIK